MQAIINNVYFGLKGKRTNSKWWSGKTDLANAKWAKNQPERRERLEVKMFGRLITTDQFDKARNIIKTMPIERQAALYERIDTAETASKARQAHRKNKSKRTNGFRAKAAQILDALMRYDRKNVSGKDYPCGQLSISGENGTNKIEVELAPPSDLPGFELHRMAIPERVNYIYSATKPMPVYAVGPNAEALITAIANSPENATRLIAQPSMQVKITKGEPKDHTLTQFVIDPPINTENPFRARLKNVTGIRIRTNPRQPEYTERTPIKPAMLRKLSPIPAAINALYAAVAKQFGLTEGTFDTHFAYTGHTRSGSVGSAEAAISACK